MARGFELAAKMSGEYMRDHTHMPESLTEGIGLLVGKLERSINDLREVVNSDSSQIARLNRNLEELKKMLPGGDA